MSKKNSIIGGAVNAALETTLAVEQFLNENYCFRRNVLNGKVEFATRQPRPDGEPVEDETPNDWRPLYAAMCLSTRSFPSRLLRHPKGRSDGRSMVPLW